jgi:hypothetical protein
MGLNRMMRLEYVALDVWPWMFGLGCLALDVWPWMFGLGYLARMPRSIGVRQTGIVASFAGGYIPIFSYGCRGDYRVYVDPKSDVESKLVEALEEGITRITYD